MYCHQAEVDYTEEQLNPVVMETNLVSDDEEEDEDIPSVTTQRESPTVEQHEPQQELAGSTPTRIEFNLNGPKGTEPVVITDEEDQVRQTSKLVAVSSKNGK